MYIVYSVIVFVIKPKNLDLILSTLHHPYKTLYHENLP